MAGSIREEDRMNSADPGAPPMSPSHADSRSQLLRWLGWLAMALVAAGFAYHAAHKTVDFRVYHSTTRAMLAGNREFYGDRSGLGWPMVYRCSPLFLLLFTPFALLSLATASALWVILKLIVLLFLIRAIDRQFMREAPTHKLAVARWALVALVSFPYIVAELHSGNVQLLIFAVAAAGFCFLESRPTLSAALFALGTSVKVFPVFFIPYLWARGYRRLALNFALFLGLFLLLPSLFFGFSANLRLLADWLRQGVGLPEAGKWGIGPDYSLRGVMARYLSTMTYLPDPNFRNINFAELPPRLLQILWLAMAALAYAGLLLLAAHLRRRERIAALPAVSALEYSLLFCAQLVLAPVTEQTYFVALLFPALILSQELRLPGEGRGPNDRENRGVAVIGWMAVLLLAVPLLVPGGANQRLLAVYAPIFWGAALLGLTFLLLLRARLGVGTSAVKI
jgi:hypothetical protein